MVGVAGRIASTLRALAVDFGNRDLGLLGVSRVGISFASWCLAMALGVYGFEVGGAVAVGVVALVRLLPGALASPFAGMLGDRLPRRNVLIGSGMAVTVVLAATSTAAAMDSPAAVVAILAGVFTVAVSGYVPAESALLPALARSPQELSAANVTHSAMDNVGSCSRRLTTGVLLAVLDPWAVFAAGAAVAFLTTIGLTTIERDERPSYAADGESPGSCASRRSASAPSWATTGLRLVGRPARRRRLLRGHRRGPRRDPRARPPPPRSRQRRLSERGLGRRRPAGRSDALRSCSTGAGWRRRSPAARRPRPGDGSARGVGRRHRRIRGLAGDRPRLHRGRGRGEDPAPAPRLRRDPGPRHRLARVGAADGDGTRLDQRLAVYRAARGRAGRCWRWRRCYRCSSPCSGPACGGFEIGAPVAEEQFQLLRGNSIFSPLPVATLERISNDLVPVERRPGEEVITQGDPGDRFYLIEVGQVEVFENGEFRRNEGPGESFGEIALLREVPRTATVRTTKPTTLLALGRDQFIGAVTGHRRSHQVAHTVVDDRWAPDRA